MVHRSLSHPNIEATARAVGSVCGSEDERKAIRQIPQTRQSSSKPQESWGYGLRYAVLINPRDYGWDNSYISYSLRKYPDRFVAHGLINPENPKVVDRLRYWMKEHGFQGMRFSPFYHPNSTWLNSKAHYPLWREAERLGAVFNFYILPHQMAMLEDMAGRLPTRRGSQMKVAEYARNERHQPISRPDETRARLGRMSARNWPRRPRPRGGGRRSRRRGSDGALPDS